ncbi:hypothetical protein HDE_11058 [Halotydeus destructor]|nr:hypothetical protein HDE_11058 [Halotydeus destructor]
MSISLTFPKDTFIGVKYRAVMTYNDLVIFISSVIGTWLGLSVVRLNPFGIKYLTSSKELTRSPLQAKWSPYVPTRQVKRYRAGKQIKVIGPYVGRQAVWLKVNGHSGVSFSTQL